MSDICLIICKIIIIIIVFFSEFVAMMTGNLFKMS